MKITSLGRAPVLRAADVIVGTDGGSGSGDDAGSRDFVITSGATEETDAAFDHGTLGATATVDLADGTWHYGTLAEDCTLSLTGFVAGEDGGITLELTQDGTGGWTPTLSGVTWIGGTPTWDTTPGTTTLVGLMSRDGGATTEAGIIGGGGGAPTGSAGGDLSGTYPNPSVVDDSHNHTAATLPPGGGIGAILITDTPAGSPLVFADLLQNDAGTDLLYADA